VEKVRDMDSYSPSCGDGPTPSCHIAQREFALLLREARVVGELSKTPDFFRSTPDPLLRRITVAGPRFLKPLRAWILGWLGPGRSIVEH
jgi:hypothetical protein